MHHFLYWPLNIPALTDTMPGLLRCPTAAYTLHYLYRLKRWAIWVLLWLMVATMESEEEKGPYISWIKTVAKPYALSRCTFQASLLLLEHSFWLSSAVQLSGKAHKDSDYTIVIAIVYWHRGGEVLSWQWICYLSFGTLFASGQHSDGDLGLSVVADS